MHFKTSMKRVLVTFTSSMKGANSIGWGVNFGWPTWCTSCLDSLLYCHTGMQEDCSFVERIFRQLSTSSIEWECVCACTLNSPKIETPYYSHTPLNRCRSNHSGVVFHVWSKRMYRQIKRKYVRHGSVSIWKETTFPGITGACSYEIPVGAPPFVQCPQEQ